MEAAGAWLVKAFASIVAGAKAFGTALAFKASAGATLKAYAQLAAMAAMAVTALNVPKLESQGQVVNLQLAGPGSGLPILIGQTGFPGLISYRDTYGNDQDTLAIETTMSVGPIDSLVSFKVMDRALGWSGNPSTGVATVTSVAGVNMKTSKLFRENGFRFAFRRGLHTDNSTISTVLGQPVGTRCVVNSTHRMNGLARLIMRLQLDGKQLNFPQGVPPGIMPVARGILAYDPRKDSTYPGGSGSHRRDLPATHTWSENPFIIGLNIALGYWSSEGLMYGLGMPIEGIDVQSFVEGANVCDANAWKVGGVVFTTDDDWSIISNVLASGGGLPIDRDGRLSALVRTPRTSFLTLRQEDLAGSIRVGTSSPMRARINRITPECRDHNNNYAMTAGAPITHPDWVEADEREASTAVAYPLVQNFTQAAQLATYDLCDRREFLHVEGEWKPKAAAAEVGDLITLEVPDVGIDNINFLVLDRKINPTSLLVSLTLRQETEGKHDFALGRTDTPPAPPTLTDFDPSDPPPPGMGSWSITSTEIVSTETYELEPEDPENPPAEPILAERVIGKKPALVVGGEVNNPTVAKVLVEVRPTLDLEAMFPDGAGMPVGDALADLIHDYGWEGVATGTKHTREVPITAVKSLTSYEVAIRYETVLGAISPRLILGPAIAGKDQGGFNPGDFDWDRPDYDDPDNPDPDSPWTGRPDVIKDPTKLQELQDLADAKLLDGYAALQDALNDLADAQSEADDRLTVGLADLETNLTNLDRVLGGAITRLNGVWSIVGEHDGEGLRKTVIDLIESSTSDDSDIVTRLTGLEQVVNAEGVQALARMTNLTQLENAIDASYARITSLNGLQAQVTSQGQTISGHSTRLTSVETGLNGKANVTDLNAIGSRVTTAEQDISAANSRLDIVETDVAGKASSTSVGNIQAEVTGARNGSTNLSAQLATMRQAVVDGLAGKTNVTDTTNLTTTVTTQGQTIAAHNTRISQVETDVAGKAASSELTTLRNEVVGARNGSANLNAQLTTMRQTYTDGLAGKAGASEFNSLQSTVTTQGQTISAHAGRLTTVETDLTGKANTSLVTTQGNEITAARNGAANLKSRIDGLQTTLTDAINLRATNTQLNTLSSEIDLKVESFHQPNQPSTSGRNVGDLWADSDDNNQLYRFNGSSWVAMADLRGEQALAEITAARGGQSSLSARFTQLNDTIIDGLAGKASTTSVNSLTATVNSHTSSISTIAQTTADVEGKVNAKWGLVLNANGKISGISSENDGTTSWMDIQVDRFRLSNGSAVITPFTYVGGVLSAGSLRLSGSININDRFIVDPQGNLTQQSATSGTRTVRTHEGTYIYDASGIRVELGKLLS